MNLTLEAQEFLWYSLFNKKYDDLVSDREYALKICAQRAYLDMSRTLKFDPKKKKHEDFRDEICAIIINGIKKLLTCYDKSEFDDKHSEICTEIIAAAKGANILELRTKCEKVFYYGQAQKWLNMTMKYMRIMGFWADELKPLETYLHVPVDNIVMQKASEKGVKLTRTDGSSSEYIAEILPWSKWESDNYKTFQNELQGRLKEVSPQEMPMDWESRIWLEGEK